MSDAVTFRCRGRRDRGAEHLISVSGGLPFCSCNGVHWCSHIDATLISGERHMVPQEDRPKADLARRRLSREVKPPPGWQAAWRDDMVWRGLAAPRTSKRDRMMWDGRPTICFIGSGDAGPRSEYVEQGESLGWKVVDAPTDLSTLVVMDEASKRTKRGDLARSLDLPVVDYAQWGEWCYDMTNSVMDRIEEHGHDPCAHRDRRASDRR